MAHLAGQHRDLSPVMGVVSDQVSEKPSDIWMKAFDTAIGLESARHDIVQCLAALVERSHGLLRSDGGLLQLCRNRGPFGGRLQPHDAYIVHVRDDGGDAAAFASGGFAFHAAGGMLSIKYWLMRLFVPKALIKAPGS